jgi:O-antigen ligase
MELVSEPLVGAGFESFWMGERVEHLWSVFWWRPNEAHNGYLEILLNLGWIGVLLFGIVMVTAYGRIMNDVVRSSRIGPLRLSYFVAAAICGLTEAAFRVMNPLWFVFMLVSMLSAGGSAVGRELGVACRPDGVLEIRSSEA